MAADMVLRETCMCGATLDVSGTATSCAFRADAWHKDHQHPPITDLVEERAINAHLRQELHLLEGQRDEYRYRLALAYAYGRALKRIEALTRAGDIDHAGEQFSKGYIYIERAAIEHILYDGENPQGPDGPLRRPHPGEDPPPLPQDEPWPWEAQS